VLFTAGGTDYTAGPYTVTILAGDTSASADITINDDNILEGSETFTIEIDSSSLPTGVTVGGTGEATVAIDNDDCKLIYDILQEIYFFLVYVLIIYYYLMLYNTSA